MTIATLLIRCTIIGIVLSAFLGLAPSKLAAENAIEKITIKQRQLIEHINRNYVLENPEIVEAAIRKLEKNKRLAAIQADQKRVLENVTALYGDPDTPILGNPDGDISIVEFVDHGCGVCKRFHPILKELIRTDPGIRLLYKEWPILGANSVLASRAAIASRRQGKYKIFLDALLGSPSPLSTPNIMALAQSVSIKIKQLKKDMKSPKVDEILLKNYRLAERLGLNGTPSLVIEKKLFRGGRDLQTLRAIVQDIRYKKRTKQGE
ncbi:MAG: DsbA family protein [Pseudomonadota bacterium]|nr:DsbA family protein [Pseudomonadota bacterium]